MQRGHCYVYMIFSSVEVAKYNCGEVTSTIALQCCIMSCLTRRYAHQEHQLAQIENIFVATHRWALCEDTQLVLILANQFRLHTIVYD